MDYSLYSSAHLQQKPNTKQQFIQYHNRTLQIIDMQFQYPLNYGFVIFGYTKCGMTSACHLISGNILKGVIISGQEKIQVSVSKNKNAKIGNTPCSQTHHPNIFQTKYPHNQQQKAYIIDTPGFGDTYGAIGLLRSRYSHYKVFEKIKNMKFILCFDSFQLNNTAQLFIDTIVQFTSYFKNYKEQKHQIWKSCVFLINKVDENCSNLNDLKQRLKEIVKKIKIHKKLSEDLIKQFIFYMVENDKLVTIKRYKWGQVAKRQDLLSIIDLKTSWWSRQFDNKKQNEVQMSKINVNITKPLLVQLTRNDISKQEFMALIDYYNERVNQFFQPFNKLRVNSCSLDSIINELVNDAMDSSNSRNFLNLMKQYVDKYYYFDNDGCYYKSEREKFIKSVVNTLKQAKVKEGQKYKMINPNVKKFKILQLIQKEREQHLAEKYEQIQQGNKYPIVTQRSFNIIKRVNNIIRELIKVTPRSKLQIISKYWYIINRLIKLLTIIQNITIGQNGKQNYQKLLSVTDNKFIHSIEQPFVTFINLNYSYEAKNDLKFYHILQIYLSKLNQNQLNNMNWPLIDMILCYKIRQNDIELVEKLMISLQKISKHYLNQVQHHESNIVDTAKLIKQLIYVRNKYLHLVQVSQHIDQGRLLNLQFIFLIRKVTDILGKLLLRINKYDLAKRVYESIMYVYTVCKIYKLQIQQLAIQQQQDNQKKHPNIAFQLRMQYFEYMKKYFHQSETVIILQQSFEHAKNEEQLQRVSQYLIKQLLQKYKNANMKSKYVLNLTKNNFYENFEDNLIKQLQQIQESNKNLNQKMLMKEKMQQN